MGRKNKLKILENVEITQIADQGVGVGRVEGKVIFVENTVPGDLVNVQLNKSRKDFASGYVVQMQQPSSLRQEPFCAHFDVCGGCTWQTVSYATQLEFKSQLVKDALRRIGKITEPEPLPILASPHDKYYRNKMEFTFSAAGYVPGKFSREEVIERKPAVGFHVRGQFAHVFDMQHCYLQPFPSNEIRLALRSYALMHALPFYDLRNHTGYMRNLIIRNTLSGGLMVIIVVAEDQPKWLTPMMEHIQQTFPEITSLNYCINQKQNDSIYDQEVVLFSGSPFLVEKIDDIQYHLGPRSFFQTNPEQAIELYHQALAFADLKKEDVLYDFYTGLGSIALLAAKYCKKVIGVEYVEAAVQDADMNAKLNGIENCEFVCGDMAKIFDDAFIARYGKANVVITDPPRAGMHKDVCDKLLELAPEKIVYVSCNPVTQARDLLLLSPLYEVVKIQPVDMFPQTYHVENIVLLNKKAE